MNTTCVNSVNGDATTHHEDRDAFGYWLSGFVDGEGCFGLDLNDRWLPVPHFRINLRSDDMAILEAVKQFWQAGRLNGPYATILGKPAVCFSVQRRIHLSEVVVRHFERYPLRSKKRRDFEVWKEGVSLCMAVATKKNKANRWTSWELDSYRRLRLILKEQRAFETSGQPIEVIAPSNVSTFNQCTFNF